MNSQTKQFSAPRYQANGPNEPIDNPIDYDNLPGQLILDRYKPISEAGVGGFGTVVVAWDTRIRRKVAIKCIELRDSITDNSGKTISLMQKQEEIKTAQIKKRVDSAGEHWLDDIPGLEEARTAAMIQDENIVTVYDFELAGNTAYIIMEYVEGKTLTQFLHTYGHELTLDMLTCIFSGISHALCVAHAENVLHLDIKPDNVLIDNKGKVKVTDFGLATLADEFGFGTADAGTIGYMPPEQMRQQALDVRTDQWALASVVYEMLSGNNPFDASSISKSLNAIIDSKLVLPSQYWEDLDPQVDNCVFRALSPAMENRYSSVDEFYHDLVQHLGNVKAGQKQISAIMRDESGTAYLQEIKEQEKVPFFERLTSSTGSSAAGRILCALISALLAFIGIVNIPIFNGSTPNISNVGNIQIIIDLIVNVNIFGFIAIGVVAIVGGILPALGISFAMICLSVAMFYTQNIIIGIVLCFVAIAWGYMYLHKFFASKQNQKIAPSNCAGSFAIFGSFGFSQVSPVLTGIFCKPIDAICSCILGFVMCAILASFGSNSLIGWEPINYLSISLSTMNGQGAIQTNFICMASSFTLWIIGASWLVTSISFSLLMESSKLVIRMLGPVLAFAILTVGLCLGNYFDLGPTLWQPEGWQMLPTCIACIIAAVVVYFAPARRPVEQA